MSSKKQVVTQFPGSKAASVGMFDPNEFNAKVKAAQQEKEAHANEAEAADQPNDQPKKPKEELIKDIVAALKNVYDPEIPLNIYDLGLIYNVDIDDDYIAYIEMTLTTPGCPVAQTFPLMVEQRVSEVAGVVDAEVNLVWDPPWTKERMSEEALLTLGLI